MKITTATDMGGRSHQEDGFVIFRGRKGVLLAVMDGHTGDGTAVFVAENLKRIFAPAIKRFGARRALSVIFNKLNLLTREMESGSTLSVVWITKKGARAHIAILGDSPIIVKTPGHDTWLAPEHNVRTNLKDRGAAVRRGGTYGNGYLFGSGDKGLQLSRALGDSELDDVLDRTPEIFSVPIKKGTAIILASDGVLDPSHEESTAHVERLVKMVMSGSGAKDLVEDALRRRTGDNVTAVVCVI